MSNIRNYSNIPNANNPISYAKIGSNTTKIQEFVKYLHAMKPLLEKEFDDLKRLSETHQNEVFPIKMAALSALYNAEEPLYKWYVEKAKTQAC